MKELLSIAILWLPAFVRAGIFNLFAKITINETLLYRDVKYVVDAFKDGIKIAGG